MKTMIFLMCFVFTACAWAQGAAPAAVAAAAPGAAAIVEVPAELLEPTYLYEVTRHLYRWYMNESDVEKQAGVKEFPFWVRRLDVKLDAGDQSEIAEILLPLVGIEVKVKKADYTIEEMGITVKSKSFRIINVARIPIPTEPPPGYAVVNVGYEEMKAYLFRTRAQAEFPDAVMGERLRVALREHLGLDPAKREAGEQVVHIAPLSPVANELWVFWENKKLLIRFASDIDLENPEMWKHQTLGVRTYDILNQTVVSLDEAAGSNAFLTRDQVGRALYNCIVLGKRMVTINPETNSDEGGGAGESSGKASESASPP
jgi:hypothetical protein